MKTRAAICFLVAAGAVFAQKGGGGAPGGGSTPGSGSLGPSTPSSATGNSNLTSLSGSAPGVPAPIFLSGKVVTGDGSPLPPGVAIQRVCQGTPHTVAYTDSRGNFSFQWGDTAGITPDASEVGSGTFPGGNSRGMSAPTIGGANVTNMTSTAGGMRDNGGLGGQIGACDLRASVAGYTSTTVSIFMHRAMDNPDVGRIVLHRNTAVQGTSISATTLEAPKDARKSFDKGIEALRKGKTVDAEKDFEKAVAVYPRYADAWVELGRLHMQENATGPAKEAFLKAMNADSKLVPPWLELGLIAAREENWRDSANYLDKALKLDPVDFPQAWYVDGVANFNLKQLDAAEKSVREALKLDPGHKNPRADYLLGLVLIDKRDYAGAATELKSYLAMAPAGENHDQVQKQLEEIEKLQTPAQP